MVAVTLVPRRAPRSSRNGAVSRETLLRQITPEWSRFDHSMQLRAIVDSSFGADTNVET